MGRRGRPRHPDILTPREWEVLELLHGHLSNEQIAERLGISLDGAKYHVSQILSKLGVATREEAAAWPEERRAWWARWPLWARIAGAATVLAAAGGFLILAAFVRRGQSEDEIVSTSGSSSTQVPANGLEIPFEECGSNRDWVQPPLEQVLKHHYLEGVPTDEARQTYGRHFFEVVGGNGALSANQGWLASTGLSQEGVGSYADPQVPPWGASGSCLFESDAAGARLYLIGYQAAEVYQLGSGFAVRVSPLARGYTAINIRPSPLGIAAAAGFYFVDSAGSVLDVLCSSGTCPLAATCGDWSSASGNLGSILVERYGEIRNCGLFFTSWVITTLGNAGNSGVIGVYRCDGSDASCLDGHKDHPLSSWTFYSSPFPGGITLLGGGDSNKLIVSDGGHQLTFEIATGAFDEDLSRSH